MVEELPEVMLGGDALSDTVGAAGVLLPPQATSRRDKPTMQLTATSRLKHQSPYAALMSTQSNDIAAEIWPGIECAN
jgi:hypothetical protein